MLLCNVWVGPNFNERAYKLKATLTRGCGQRIEIVAVAACQA